MALLYYANCILLTPVKLTAHINAACAPWCKILQDGEKESSHGRPATFLEVLMASRPPKTDLSDHLKPKTVDVGPNPAVEKLYDNKRQGSLLPGQNARKRQRLSGLGDASPNRSKEVEKPGEAVKDNPPRISQLDEARSAQESPASRPTRENTRPDASSKVGLLKAAKQQKRAKKASKDVEESNKKVPRSTSVLIDAPHRQAAKLIAKDISLGASKKLKQTANQRKRARKRAQQLKQTGDQPSEISKKDNAALTTSQSQSVEGSKSDLSKSDGSSKASQKGNESKEIGKDNSKSNVPGPKIRTTISQPILGMSPPTVLAAELTALSS